MRHKAITRDPTIPLVLGLVAVIALLLVARQLSGGDDKARDPGDAPGPQAATDASVPPPTEEDGFTVRRGVKVAKIPIKCVPRPEDTEIVAVSYNIKSFAGGGNADNIAAVLRDSGADVVLLQEIKNANVGNQPAALAERLGMEYAFGQNVSYGSSGGYGTAVLSRFPIISSENSLLPRPGNTQQRGLLHVVVDIEGKEVSLYNTHLQNKSESARVQQANAIVNIVGDDTRPRILAGDMNAQPTSGPMNILGQLWTDTWGTVGVGGGGTRPYKSTGRIDYLMHGGAGIEAQTSDVLQARLSDHLPVRASYVVDGPGGKVCFQVPVGLSKKQVEKVTRKARDRARQPVASPSATDD